jgi:heme/copper-type cytochrome/quinol oxidase subunit 2
LIWATITLIKLGWCKQGETMNIGWLEIVLITIGALIIYVIYTNDQDEEDGVDLETDNNIEKPKIINIQIASIGLIAMFIGLFLPIVYIPIMGDISYVNYITEKRIDGLLMLLLVVSSFILIVANKYKGLLFTGMASIGVMAFTLTELLKKISNAKHNLNADLALADNPFRGLADMVVNSVQLQWGWAILFIGAVLLIVSYTISDN